MSDRSELVDALLVAPAGVALVAMLEGAVRQDVLPWQFPIDSDVDAVAMAADAVSVATFGSLLAVAVDAAALRVGPWMSDAPALLAAAYRHAEDRVAIATAIHDRFDAELHAPLDPDAQQWWLSAPPGATPSVLRRTRSFAQVYGAGQFTWDGLWTVSAPPTEVHQDLIGAWELETGPVSSWHLPVRPAARVFEIHRPEDWVTLVTTFPATGRPHPEWELPGVNQHPHDLTELLSVPGQRAARTSIRRHLVPDWAAVAADHDGVHLSWAGFLTSEGLVSDLGDGDVALLRYWFSERTHWLADVFGRAVPLGPPDLGPEGDPLGVIDVRTDDRRRRHDEAVLTTRLGR